MSNELFMASNQSKDWQDKVSLLVKEMSKMPQNYAPITHRFAPGCYIREMFIPKDSYIIGQIHLTEHFNIFLKGKISIFCESGVKTIEAPYTCLSEPGVQKVAYTHTDCIWQNVHVTNETDLDKIESLVVAMSYDDERVKLILEKHKEVLQ